MNKYAQEPDEILDLHGLTMSESMILLEDMLDREELSHVRIIVGKGMHSKGGPVLPGFVKQFLTAKHVRFSQSKVVDGGEGALEVYL